jgi:hypothetical protein
VIFKERDRRVKKTKRDWEVRVKKELDGVG